MNARRSPGSGPDCETDFQVGWTDFAWLIGYSAKGAFELLKARIAFSRSSIREILAPDLPPKKSTMPASDPSVHLERMAFVLPRLAKRLPWRADCLVQAIAGRNWLAGSGLPGEIRIGVENPAEGKFGAHAWLVCQDKTISGGDISRYAPLLTKE